MNQQSYIELLNLTQLYLLQEYPKQVWIGEGDLETFRYFKNQAVKKAQPPAAPIKPILPQIAPSPAPKIAAVPQPPPIIPKAAIPAPAPPQPKKIEEVKKGFELEKVTVSEPLRFEELKKILGHLDIRETIPEYIVPAKFVFPEVVILVHSLTPAEEELLKKIAEAIQTRLNHACGLVSEKSWENLLHAQGVKWILGTHQLIQNSALLSKHFRESAKEGRWFLGQTPFLMLADLGLYLKESSLKASLWKVLCEILKKTS